MVQYTKWMTGTGHVTKEAALKSAKSYKKGMKLDQGISVQTRVVRKKNWRGKFMWYDQSRMSKSARSRYYGR